MSTNQTMNEIINMRRYFAEYLEKRIEEDPSIILITADLGYGMFDRIRDRFPENFINCGASEQLMIGLCVGSSYEGKKPVAYSITPFLLYRPFELIRNYVNKEQLNIKLIGSGRDKDYAHDGFSHWAEDDREIMPVLKNIESRWPTLETIKTQLDECFNSEKPFYINLKR